MKLHRPARALRSHGALGAPDRRTILVTPSTGVPCRADPAGWRRGQLHQRVQASSASSCWSCSSPASPPSTGWAPCGRAAAAQPLRDRLLPARPSRWSCAPPALLVALAVSVACAAVVTAARGTPTRPWLADAATGYANALSCSPCVLPARSNSPSKCCCARRPSPSASRCSGSSWSRTSRATPWRRSGHVLRRASSPARKSAQLIPAASTAQARRRAGVQRAPR